MSLEDLRRALFSTHTVLFPLTTQRVWTRTRRVEDCGLIFIHTEYEERNHFYESNLSVNIKVKDKD